MRKSIRFFVLLIALVFSVAGGAKENRKPASITAWHGSCSYMVTADNTSSATNIPFRVGLNIDGSSAVVQFICGAVSISEWKTPTKARQTMSGMDHGGPIEEGPGTPTPVISYIDRAGLHLQIGSGGDGSLCTLEPGAGLVGSACM